MGTCTYVHTVHVHVHLHVTFVHVHSKVIVFGSIWAGFHLREHNIHHWGREKEGVGSGGRGKRRQW